MNNLNVNKNKPKKFNEVKNLNSKFNIEKDKKENSLKKKIIYEDISNKIEKQLKIKENKINFMKEKIKESKEDDLKECIFKPKINNNSIKRDINDLFKWKENLNKKKNYMKKKKLEEDEKLYITENENKIINNSVTYDRMNDWNRKVEIKKENLIKSEYDHNFKPKINNNYIKEEENLLKMKLIKKEKEEFKLQIEKEKKEKEKEIRKRALNNNRIQLLSKPKTPIKKNLSEINIIPYKKSLNKLIKEENKEIDFIKEIKIINNNLDLFKKHEKINFELIL